MHVVRITKIRTHGFDKDYEGIYRRVWKLGSKGENYVIKSYLKIEIIF